MAERVSNIARQILEYGLEADPSKVLQIPRDFAGIAGEIYQVPEKPEGFTPRFKETEYKGRIVLVSGGLDSTVSWLMAAQETRMEPRAYYVDMGQEYGQKEIHALQAIGIPFDVIKVPEPPHLHDGKWKHIHPGRNFYYLSLVAEQAQGPSQLVLSAVEGEISDRGGDKSRFFFDETNRLFAKLDTPVQVVTPLDQMTKTDLVAWAIHNDFLGVVKKTISCFSPEEGRCGRCQSCLRTWIAFSNNDIDIPFAVHPMEGAVEFVQKYEKVMGEAMKNNDFSHYSPKRIAQTLGAFAKYRGH